MSFMTCSSMHPVWLELDDGERRGMYAVRDPQSILSPGKTVLKYIWQSSVKLFEEIHLAKRTFSFFEKS